MSTPRKTKPGAVIGRNPAGVADKAPAAASTAAITQGFWAPPELPFLEIRSTFDSLSPYAEHFHQSFSLGLILKGRTIFTCGRREHLAEAGDLVLIEPEMVHSCNPMEGGARSYHMLHLDPLWCLEQIETPAPAFLRLPPPAQNGSEALPAVWNLNKRVLKDQSIFRQVLNFVEAVQADSFDAAPAFGRLLGRLLAGILAGFSPARESQTVLEARGLFCGDLIERRKLAEVAARLGLRRESLIRGFRRSRGLPPGAYRQCLRLLEGRRLLRRGSGIAEAALAAGFTDQSHFHRMFVKYFSATPRQYKMNRSLSYKK